MAVIVVANALFQVYIIMLFVRIIGSWLPELQQYRFMQFIAFYVDPYLNIFRSIIPPLGMIDISPIAAFLCLRLLIQPLVMGLLGTLFL